MAYFQQTRDEFTSLLDEDYSSQWTNITIDELTASERQIIESFHAAASQGAELQPEVLLVQAENGFLKDIYAASIRQGEDGELLVKLGQNTYPAKIETSERKVGSRTIKEYVVLCGELFGSVDFADQDSEVSVKVDNSPVKITYTRCWVDFSAGGSDEWRVPLTLDLTQFTEDSLGGKLPKQAVLDAIADGSLATLLKPVAGGTGNRQAIGMQELGEGSFRVIGIRSVATQNGDRFLIDVDGYGEVWSRGGADKQLHNPDARAKIDAGLTTEGATVTLRIGNIQIKKTKDGEKVYLDSNIRVTMPAGADVPVAVKPVVPVVPVEAAVDYDLVPF